jgi:uncharacterized YccA/Bax inhibitor family protein
MRTTNPALGPTAFESHALTPTAQPMTLQGTVQKSFILLVLAVVAACFTWKTAGGIGMPLGIGGAIGGFIVCLVLCFKKEWAPGLAPAYAILEGLFLGAISAYMERVYTGIVSQAVMLTFGTFFALLAAYTTGMIKPSENFKLGIVAATGGIALVYLVSIVLRLFGIQMPFIHDSGAIGIAFSAFVVVIAALNLVLDFDFIENGCESRAPRYLEWYAAFGLMVTLVWLYIEILRLLSKLRSR